MQRLGPYELLGELGRGAMGVVYRARHRVTGAERALKVIDSSSVDREGLARFKRESEALARVDKHPNLVRVHESGIEGRTWFYAMELVQGTSLRKLLAQGPLPTERALELSAKLARALAHCHANGVIHRDVKPDNVLVDEHGEPRLVDFGLVRDLYKNRLTRTGDYLGTPAYMAAEQIRGEAATAETDVYALGMVTFEALTGRRPYSSSTVHELSAEILAGSACTLESLKPELPLGLSKLLERCLAAERRARPASAEEVAHELETVLEGLRSRSFVPARSVFRLKRALAVLVGLSIALGGASVAVLVQRRSDKADAESRRVALHESASALARAARVRGEARGLDATSLVEAARGALESEPEDARDPRAVRDLAVGRAWAALARHEAGVAIAAVDSASTLFAPGDPALLELRHVLALALLERGSIDEALDVLRTLETPDLVRLRARVLLDHGHWDELDTVVATDDVVHGCKLWSLWARGPAAPKDGDYVALAANLQKNLKALSPAAFEEFRPLLAIAVARAPILHWSTLGDVERGVSTAGKVEIFLDYAEAVETAWRHGSVAHADREQQLAEVIHVLEDLEQRGYQLMQKQLMGYIRALEKFDALGTLLAAPLPDPELSKLPLRIIVDYLRLQASSDGDKGEADLRTLEAHTHADVILLRGWKDRVSPAVRTALCRLLLSETDRSLGVVLGDDVLEGYLGALEDSLNSNDASPLKNETILTRGRASADPAHYHLRAASVSARLASRKGPGPERERLLARAVVLLERASALIQKAHGDYSRLHAQDEYYVALIRHDEKRLDAFGRGFGLDSPTLGDPSTFQDCIVENLLLAGRARERGDVDEAKLRVARAAEANRQAGEHGIAIDGWYAFLAKRID